MSMPASQGSAASLLEAMLDRSEELKVFPPVAQRIVRVSRHPLAGNKHLEWGIEQDPAISARILKIANSAYYGLPREVLGLSHALSVMGFGPARDLALGLALSATNASQLPEHETIWRHSMRTAGVARTIARYTTKSLANEAFLSGLLHDLGQLILLATDTVRYQKLCQMVGHENVRIIPAERMAYGFTHAELGASCLKRWNLPEVVAEAIRRHHDPVTGPSRSPVHQLAALIALSDIVATKMRETRVPEAVARAMLDSEANSGVGLLDRQARAVAEDLASMAEPT